MKTQLNIRKGDTKDGFRILKRFPSMKEAREYVVNYLSLNPGYKPGFDKDIYYNKAENTMLWISGQFTPVGHYFYPRDRKIINKKKRL